MLYLENCGLNADISEDLFKSCTQSCSLKCLKLNDNKDLFSFALQEQEEEKVANSSIMNTCTLEELSIENCSLDAKSVTTNWLTSSPLFSHTILPQLRYLNISHNSLGSAVGCALLKLIADKAVHLHTLICCNTNLALEQEEEKEKECEVIPDTEAAIDINNNVTNSASIQRAVAEYLGNHKTLSCLDLSGNRQSVGVAGLRGLSLSTSLVSLSLHDCDLGSEAGAFLDYILHNNNSNNVLFPALQDIDLSGNNIQKTEMLGLLQALKIPSNSSSDMFRLAPLLRILVIAANPGVDDIDEEVLGEVQRVRPGLVIVRRATDTGEQPQPQ